MLIANRSTNIYNNAELNEFFGGFLNIEVKKYQISYRETKNLTRVPHRMYNIQCM